MRRIVFLSMLSSCHLHGCTAFMLCTLVFYKIFLVRCSIVAVTPQDKPICVSDIIKR
jgi:hypothetical protein